MRLDEFLVLNKLARTKSRAQNLIKMGFVDVEGKIVQKCGHKVESDNKITLLRQDNFASLGEFKLKKALTDFNFSPKYKDCMDIGASNGGFTKVLLDEGVNKVFAVDVGECAFQKDLKSDKRVIVKEKLNARYMDFNDIGQKVDLIVIDVSFISIKQILANMKKFLKENGHIIALIKPQFETQKANLTKKGLVKSQKIIDTIKISIESFCKDEGFKILDETQIFEYFIDKNKEWFIIMQIS